MDAPRQIPHDHAGRQFYLARPAGRRGGRCRRTPQEKSVGLADEVQLGKKALTDLSGARKLVRVWSPGVPGRDFGARRTWRKALGGMIGFLLERAPDAQL